MIALSYYLLITAGYMLAFWCLYLLFFRNRSSHAASRAWLLLTVTVPLLLPAIHISMPQQIALPAPVFVLPEVAVRSKPAGTAAQSFFIEGLLLAVYCTIAAWLLLRIIVSYYKVHQILRTGNRQEVAGRPVYTQTNIGPGSMGKAIFFPMEDTDPQMLQHELAHVRLKHSADLLLVQLISALLWPNILIHIILRELKTVHEFQADAYAGSAKSTDYSLLLLNVTLNTNQFSTIHTFHQPPLKRRIMMLQQTNNRLKKGSIFGALFLASVFSVTALWAQQASHSKKPVTEASEKPTRQQAKSNNSPTPKDSSTVFTVVDQMPEFNGDISEWLGSNITYPENAHKAGAAGRSIVRFVVNEDGIVSDPQLLRSAGNEQLDSEAVAVLTMMPAWKPGEQNGRKVKVYFTLPITWALDDK